MSSYLATRLIRPAAWLAVVCGFLVAGGSLRAEEEQPTGAASGNAGSNAGIVKPQGPARAVHDAFQLTRTAENEADFAAIIDMLDDSLKSDDLDDATRQYARRLKGWAHNKRGEALADDGKESLATVQFELAVEMNPDHWKGLHNRGVSYARIGKPAEAIADFTRVIELNRGYANAWFNRGELYYQQGDLAAAIRDYSEAVRRQPDDPGYYMNRGNAYHQLRRYPEAIEDFNRAIELTDGENVADDKRAIPFVYRGDTHTVMGNYEQAAEDYRRAIQLNNRLGRAYQSTAWLMATCPEDRFRDPPRAVQAARRAIELDGNQRYQYLETLAASLASAGQYDEAVVVQKQAVAAAPSAMTETTSQRLQLYEQERPYLMRPRTAQGQWSPANR